MPWDVEKVEMLKNEIFKFKFIPTVIVISPKGKIVTMKARTCIVDDPAGDSFPYSRPTFLSIARREDAIIVHKDGREESLQEVCDRNEYVALYFSAAFCKPCKTFTPRLSAMYPGIQSAGTGASEVEGARAAAGGGGDLDRDTEGMGSAAPSEGSAALAAEESKTETETEELPGTTSRFGSEVIFVSADTDRDQTMAYAEGMPFPMLAFDADADASADDAGIAGTKAAGAPPSQQLALACGVKKIPQLTIIHAPTGRIIHRNAKAIAAEPECAATEFPWLEPVAPLRSAGPALNSTRCVVVLADKLTDASKADGLREALRAVATSRFEQTRGSIGQTRFFFAGPEDETAADQVRMACD